MHRTEYWIVHARDQFPEHAWALAELDREATLDETCAHLAEVAGASFHAVRGTLLMQTARRYEGYVEQMNIKQMMASMWDQDPMLAAWGLYQVAVKLASGWSEHKSSAQAALAYAEKEFAGSLTPSQNIRAMTEIGESHGRASNGTVESAWLNSMVCIFKVTQPSDYDNAFLLVAADLLGWCGSSIYPRDQLARWFVEALPRFPERAIVRTPGT